LREKKLTKLLGVLLTAVLLLSTGAVSCGPQQTTPSEPPAGGAPPAEPPPGEPPPGQPQPGEPPPEAPGGGEEAIIMLVASPEEIPQGGCSLLRWEVNAPPEWHVLLDGQEMPQVGELEVCPPATTTYELLVQTTSGPQTRSVTVSVQGGAPGPGAEPAPPGPGSEPAPPGPGPQGTQPGPGPQGTPPGPGPQPTQPGAAPTTTPGAGCAGSPTFSSFTASPNSITAGQQVTLSWGAVTNGTSGPLVGSVVLTPGNYGEVGSPGSRQVNPTTTTTYRLTARGCGGTATKEVTVYVGTAAPTATSTLVIAVVTGVVLAPTPTGTATLIPSTSSLKLTNNCGRFIDSVYIRESGVSSWGNDRLSQSGYLGHGESRSFQLATGDYQFRAECCGGLVVSEHSAEVRGSYDWTVVAALDIHNDTSGDIYELYIVSSGQAGWGSNWLTKSSSWPGCDPPYVDYLGVGEVMRCYFSPGSYDLQAVTQGGQVYTKQYASLQGNSAWYVKTQFYTPPS